MSLDERLSWFLLGVLVGLLISWLKDLRRGEQRIEQKLNMVDDKLEEVDEHVKQKRVRDDAGFMRFPYVADVMVLAVVIMTAYAAFVSQKAANDSESNTTALTSVVSDLEDTQAELRAVTSCNTVYQKRTIKALNERTTFSGAQALSNVRLQKAQARFLQIALLIPPVTASELRLALEAYYGNLANFVDISSKNRQKVLEFAYPTDDELSTCISEAVKNAKKEAEAKNDE